MPLERIVVDADQVDVSLVDRAVSALREGRQVVLPTETVYGIAAVPDIESSVESLRQFKGRPDQRPFTFHIADLDQIDALAQPLSTRTRRLVDRFWPGPLTIIARGKSATSVGLRIPAHAFTRAVLRRFPQGLFLTSVNRSGEPPLLDPDEIAEAMPDLDLLFDAGRPPLGKASTIVDASGTLLEVAREGILSRDEILRAAAATCLFVCTGNTCRSPMAEALARKLAADALGVPVEDLAAHGLVLGSAGISTFGGMPASEHAERAMEEVGIDIRNHTSTQLTPDLVARAERIYCLTDSHRQALIALLPEATPKTEVLGGDTGDIPDPFGADLPTYRETRDRIEATLRGRLAEILALVTAE